MRHSDPALRSFSQTLATVLRAGDRERLREFLRGRALPALGGDLPPHEIVRQALFLNVEARTLASEMGALLARIVREETQSLRKSRKPVNPAHRRFLLGALILATEIPSHPELFRALRELSAALRSFTGSTAEALGVLRLPLWQALTYQQTDPSMEPEWFDLLRSFPDAESIEDPPTLLLLAWRGLLWIPPESKGKATIVNFDRIEKGLLAFAGTVQGQEEAEDLLREALETLRDTFPRSGEFWEEHLRPRMGNWPRELRESALQIWPGLQSFFWQFPTADEQGSLSLHWRSVGEHLDAQSPWESFFTPEIASFWDEVGVRDRESYFRKIQTHLSSRQVLRDSFDASRKSIHLLAESPTDVQIIAGSLLFHWTDPKPDLIRLEGGTALIFSCKGKSSRQKEWSVLEPPPSLTRFAFDKDVEHILPKAFAFQEELVHQAVAVLAQYDHFERQTSDHGAATFRQIERHALELRRALVPEIFSALQSSITEIEAAMAQLVQQRSTIWSVPGLQPTTALHLSFAGPAPERYLRDLAALPSALKAAALDQLRRALQSAWNPLERLYLQAITTLMALQEEDFLWALQELEALRRASAVLTVEHQVLKLHAKAGAGARKASVQLFKALEQLELATPVQKALDLLDDAFGLSGRETVPDPQQHEELIRQEAAMIEAAGSLPPAA